MLTVIDILFVIAVTVKTYGNYGYLSMIDWPLLPVCVSHLLKAVSLLCLFMIMLICFVFYIGWGSERLIV